MVELLIVTATILCPILQGIAIFKLKNGWLIAAKLSLGVLCVVYLFTLFLIVKGHHLWFAPILLTSPIFLTYLTLLFLLNWMKANKGKANIIYPIVSIPVGFVLISPFVWGVASDYIHGRGHGIGDAFVPLILFGLFLLALIGVQLFISGMICLKPKQRQTTVFGILICIAITGSTAFIFWSQENIDYVVNNVEKIAGDNPYCIYVASGHRYKEATSLSDFSGYNMRGSHSWGIYGGSHAILAVGNGAQTTFYHWSYNKKSFIADTGRLTVPCSPRKHFSLTLSEH